MNNWKLIRNQAVKFLQAETEWTSFVRGRRYKIQSVSEESLIIEKVSGGNPVSLSKKVVDSVFDKINNKKVIKKAGLIKSVARETAIVIFHPSLVWDSNKKVTIYDLSAKITLDDATDFLKEASDDDREKILAYLTKRPNQLKFKQNLLKLYDGRCAISGIAIEALLDAAHIVDHHKTGNNKSHNGILLRADLHVLFDKGLLLIHPTNFKIHLHDSLKSTEYKKYNMTLLRKTKTAAYPKSDFLRERWNAANWVKPI